MRQNRIRFLLFFVTAVLTLMAAGPACYAQGQPVAYKDVPENGANTPYILFLNRMNVMRGYPDGTFLPGKTLTRAEVATALVNARKIVPAAASDTGFKDVPKTHWAAGFIKAAVDNGIFKGYSDGTFKPDRAVTRAELAAILVNFSGENRLNVSEDFFCLDVSAGYWAYKQIAVSLDAGLMSMSGGKFLPDSPATREVFARGTALTMVLSSKYRSVPLVGSVVLKSGKAWVGTGGEEEALVGTRQLAIGMTVRTEAGGEAEMIFEDGSGILVKPDTRLIVTSLDGRAAIKKNGELVSSVDGLELKLEEGRLVGALASSYGTVSGGGAGRTSTSRWPVLAARSLPAEVLLAAVAADQNLPWYKEARGKKVRVKVDMPWGVAAIKGTFWMNMVSAVSQVTSVLTGEAVVTANNVEVPVVQGQTSGIYSEGATPTQAATMSAGQVSQWQEVKDWVVERASNISEVSSQVVTTPADTVQPSSPGKFTEKIMEAVEDPVKDAPVIESGDDNSSSDNYHYYH